MRKIKIFLAAFLLCGWLAPLLAQPSIDDNKAHRRYWYYRTRLINDFTKIGKEQGDCLITPERNNGSRNSNVIRMGPDNIDIANQYLIALALEYKLLSRANQSTEETLKEIYYFLYAYNRLDREAEQFWGNNPPGPTDPDDMLNPANETAENGFMLREDMPSDYLSSAKNEKHYNYAMQEEGFSMSTGQNSASYTGLSYVNTLFESAFHSTRQGASNYSKKDLSQPGEKYYSMFTAFMFLIKYLPDNISYSENGVVQTFPDGTSDIKTEIRKITNHSHEYLRGNVFGQSLTDWLMEYPDGTAWMGLGAPLPFSYSLADMICNINSSFPWAGNGLASPCQSYQDGVSLTAGLAAYTTENWLGYLATPTGGDIPVMLAYNQVGSNDNGALGLGLATVILPNPVTALMAFIPEWTVMDGSTSYNSVEWADLMRLVLHEDGNIMKQKSVYANPIDVAPCTGPYQFGINDVPDQEWRSRDRNEHQDGRYDVSKFPANYPGVDFMILHNLYYEWMNQLSDAGFAQISEYKHAYNLMDNDDEMIWPVSIPIIGTIGTTGNPSNVKVFQNLKSRAQIFATASPLAQSNTTPSEVVYRAGKEIAFLPDDPNTGHPGFSIEEGASFQATIQRYVCPPNDDNNPLTMRPAGNPNQTSNDYESDAITSMPLHYVSYPASAKKSDGNFNIEKISALTSDGNRLEIMPNPNDGVFKVRVNKMHDKEAFSVNILDMQGKTVYEERNFAGSDFNLIDYPKGIYLVIITSSLGYTESKKVCIN